jgi:hypothetical protein
MKKRMLLSVITNLIVLCCMSQIRYVYINPDTILIATPWDSSFQYSMDLNNDSIQDYSFFMHWCE